MFKLIVLSICLAVALADVSHLKYFGGGLPAAASADAQAQVLLNDANVDPDGSYNWAYQTSNGINAQEAAQQKSIGNELANSVKGSYSYTAPDGKPIQVTYVADENGFQPQVHK